MDRTVKKGRWSPEEDEVLRMVNLVAPQLISLGRTVSFLHCGSSSVSFMIPSCNSAVRLGFGLVFKCHILQMTSCLERKSNPKSTKLRIVPVPLKAVEVFGRKWARVAEAVPTRNQVQVRERFVNVLDPELKRGKPWTPEEDAILVTALQECKNFDGSIR